MYFEEAVRARTAGGVRCIEVHGNRGSSVVVGARAAIALQSVFRASIAVVHDSRAFGTLGLRRYEEVVGCVARDAVIAACGIEVVTADA